jgi:hypothetical protein
MHAAERNHLESMIEEMRTSGYSGREAWISRLPTPLGTEVVAIRQLEAVATQFVSPWLEDVLDASDAWEFLRTNLLERAEELLQIASDAHSNVAPEPTAIELLAEFLSQARAGESTHRSYGTFVMCFLFAVMIVRQYLEEVEAIGQHPAFEFRFSSSNVAPSFVELAIKKLGRIPLGIQNGDTVVELFQTFKDRLADWHANV